jgi:hypothetical protein
LIDIEQSRLVFQLFAFKTMVKLGSTVVDCKFAGLVRVTSILDEVPVAKTPLHAPLKLQPPGNPVADAESECNVKSLPSVPAVLIFSNGISIVAVYVLPAATDPLKSTGDVVGFI